MKPKFGIVGCGNISRFHFEGLRRAGADIIHISDIHESAARPYVEAFGAAYSADYRALIANPEVTVVSVLTSAKFHREICLAALAAGKDVICEKTMANDADEAEEIVRVAEASGQLFFTSYMKRFFPAVQQAKALLPRLGRLFSAQVRAYQKWDGQFYEHTDGSEHQWVLDGYGGAVVKCAGSHMIDLTLHLLGRPKSLYANVDFIPGTQIDRKATALFEYADGLVASYETAIHPLDKIGYERNGWDECMEVNGTKGRIQLYTAKWDESEHRAALLVHYDNESGTSTEYRYDAIDPFHVEMHYFYDCLIQRKQGAPNQTDGFNVDVIIAAIMESSRRRASVDLDWRGR
jgi:predicted dehydrogenase